MKGKCQLFDGYEGGLPLRIISTLPGAVPWDADDSLEHTVTVTMVIANC